MNAVFNPLRLSSVSMDLLAVNPGTPQGIAARQQTRLAKLLGATLRDSRLYRELVAAGTSAETPLHALPVVTRAELMARFDDWVTDPNLKLDALRAFTADPARIGEAWGWAATWCGKALAPVACRVSLCRMRRPWPFMTRWRPCAAARHAR